MYDSLIKKQAKAFAERRKLEKKKAVVFDLDWVLCELKPESERNNHTGDEKCTDFLYNMYMGYSHYHTVVLTGRKEKYREITESWLYNNDYHFDEIIMQEWHTAQKNHIFKREKLIELKQKYDIICVVDDNPEMIEVCNDLSIPLLHVNMPKPKQTTVQWWFIEEINVYWYTCTCWHYDHEYYCFCPKCKKEITTLPR